MRVRPGIGSAFCACVRPWKIRPGGNGLCQVVPPSRLKAVVA